MKRIILFLVFLFTSFVSFAQFQIKGVVCDTCSNPLKGVIVTALNGNKVVSHSFTDSAGAYNILCHSSFEKLCFFLMGYERAVKSVDFNIFSHLEINMILEENPIVLPPITIKPEPFTVKGDTVTFDTAFYSKREDRSIGEVIARIPFVSVSSSGQVQIQGTNVNKVYIEDMDLLGSRYGLALNNLKPGDVASVSVYYNHQPIKALQNVVYSEQSAINIKLKEKSKAKWLFSLGINFAPELYNANVNTMLFGSNNQTMIVGKMNNTGIDVITETRQQNVSGKVKVYSLSDLKSGGVEDLLKVRELNLPIKSNLYNFNNTKVFSVSNLNKLFSSAQLTETFVFGYEKTSINQITHEIISGPDTIIVKSDSLLNRMALRIAEGDISYVTNKDNSYFENLFSYKVYSNEASSVLESAESGYVINYNLPKFIFKDEYKFVKRNKGKVRQLYGSLHYSNLDQQMHSQMKQNFDTENFSASINSSFSRSIGNSTLSYQPGVDMSYNSLMSWIEPGDETMCNDLSLFTFHPNLDFKWNYKLPESEFNLSLPISFRYDNLNGDNSIYCIYNPYVSLKYRLGDSYVVQTTASIGNNIAGIDKMGRGYIFNGYRNLFSYHTLQKNLFQNYSLNFNYSNYSSYLFATLGAFFNTMSSNLMPEYFYYPDYTFITYKERNSNMRSMRVMLDVKKKFGDSYTLDGCVEYSYLQMEQFLQGQLFKFDNQGYTFKLGLDFYIGENFNVVYDGSFTLSSLGGGTASKYRNSVNELTINWYPFENLSLLSRNYIYWNSKYESSSKPFLDIEVVWNVTDKFSLNFQAYNLLDVVSFEYSYFSGANEIKKITSLKGCECMLGLNVNF